MTTKQKIMASIWVPIVSMYILIAFVIKIITGFGPNKFGDLFFTVFQLFLLAAIYWMPLLIITLIIENLWIKNEMEQVPIFKIFMVEAIICLIPVWILIQGFSDYYLIFIALNLSLLLSIAARWGYLKWRKIC